MILIDSNVVVNSTKAEYDYLRRYLADQTYCISVITQIEVLGFHKLTAEDKEAIRLRQLQKISLGDAIIAATAIVNQLELVTYNTKDFKWIDELSLANPLDLPE